MEDKATLRSDLSAMQGLLEAMEGNSADSFILFN
jgi:hypothetical protein